MKGGTADGAIPETHLEFEFRWEMGIQMSGLHVSFSRPGGPGRQDELRQAAACPVS
jgi:hypothetical protein